MKLKEKIQNILYKSEEKEYLLLDFIRNNYQNKFLDLFFSALSQLTAAGFIWFVLSFYLLFSLEKNNIFLALSILIALFLHIILSHYLLKNYIARQRPNKKRKEQDFLCEIHTKKTSYSFPSGHVCSSFAAIFLLYFYQDPLFIYALIFAVLVAFSRIYLYKHFPTDVLMGIILGFFFACIAYFIVQDFGILVFSSFFDKS